MKGEKREPKSYKAPDRIYRLALQRARKEKRKLAQVMEGMLYAYASGSYIVYTDGVEEAYKHLIPTQKESNKKKK